MTPTASGRDLNLSFMTATWRGDLGHFKWLRRSLEHAGLAAIPHRVVVHSEDLERFQPLARDGVELIPTASVLPGNLEARRIDTLRRIQRRGRRLTKLAVSLHKRFGMSDWVRYSGWQIQQISKLAFAGAQRERAVVVLDSDLIFTRAFDLRLFLPQDRIAQFEHLIDTPGLWHPNAHALLQQPISASTRFNGYVGTPFVFDPLTVQALQGCLERLHGKPWHEVLLAQPVSSWSEFCIYNLYARSHGAPERLAFVRNPHGRDLYREDLSGDRAAVEAAVRSRFADPQIYFTNIPTQRLAAGRWSIDGFDGLLEELLA